MLSAVFSVLFGVSLLPGRKPLCLRFAERISGGIMPDGAAEYCRRLTWLWFFILLATASLAIIDWRLSFASPVVIAAMFFVEGRIRRRRFSLTFHTSGSSGGPKTIVKPFEALAREVALHRDFYKDVCRPDETTFLATVEPGHMYGTLWRVMLPKALGCRVDPDVILTPESLLAKMRECRSVFLVTTPSFLQRFTAYAAQYDVPRNAVEITTSGSLLPADVARRTRDVFGVTPREIFGSTETGGVAWRRQTSGGEPWLVFDHVRVSTRDDRRLAVCSPFSSPTKYTLGDAVVLAPDARSFSLLGRIDRLAKINEIRVNLAEMEDKIRAIGFADCALAVLDGERGPYIGALLVPGPRMASLDTLRLRSLMLPVFPKGTVPKRFRFALQIPRNAQGKVVAAIVRSRLLSALAEPQLNDVAVSHDSLSAGVCFPQDAPYFRGHFPGMPILPGVAQLGLAAQWAASLLGDDTKTLRTVKKMKFTQIIRPGDYVRVSLTRRGDAEVAYEFTKRPAPCGGMFTLISSTAKLSNCQTVKPSNELTGKGGESCSSGVLVF